MNDPTDDFGFISLAPSVGKISHWPLLMTKGYSVESKVIKYWIVALIQSSNKKCIAVNQMDFVELSFDEDVMVKSPKVGIQ